MGCCGFAQGVCSRNASSAAERNALEDMVDMVVRGGIVDEWRGAEARDSIGIYALLLATAENLRNMNMTYPHLFKIVIKFGGPCTHQGRGSGEANILGHTGHD